MAKRNVRSVQDILDTAAEEGMPLERMRFFIDEDRKEAKCFGIYQNEESEWVVYKNKTDGSRAVRYQGPSEEEAAKILWEKIEDEIRKRKKNKDWWEHQESLVRDPAYAKEYDHLVFGKTEKANRPAPRRNRKRRITIAVIASLTAFAVFVIGVYLYTEKNRAVREAYQAVGREPDGYYVGPAEQVYYKKGLSFYQYDPQDRNWESVIYDADGKFDIDFVPEDFDAYVYHPVGWSSSLVPLPVEQSEAYERWQMRDADDGYYIDPDQDTYYKVYETWYLWDGVADTWQEYDEIPDGWDAWSHYDDAAYEEEYAGSPDRVPEDFGDYMDRQYTSHESDSGSDDAYDSFWSQEWDDSWNSTDDYDYDFDDWDSNDTDWDTDW